MENFENWNKNVRNKNSDENQRDYDKEPIIIKDYHQIFNGMLFENSALLSFIILLNIHIFIYKYLMFNENDEIINEIGDYIAIINGIAILNLLCYFIISYYIFIIRRKAKIHFTNKSIKFYEFEKTQFSSSNANLRDIICKPFWCYDRKNVGLSFVVYSVIVLVIFKAIGIFFIFFMFLSNLFLKICFYLIVKKNLKNFTAFPIIIIDEPQRNGWAYATGKLRGKFYMVCIFDKKDYLEIKQWFLDKKNINIDNIEKLYFKR
ncbi:MULTISPECIES: hypothetical protein [unclassified Campylobacter]|uniref:hypothetical protein n=1 Tax=unclassified Campylobacter TaxID=2593542 RepID=UPI0022E9B22A|nr:MULTISPECIES: hypothetical protein [unclassified Campylobacter]MDA3042581.1 hypothetical protein [Campylobacter sp. JMF_09 ED2]MDA3044605.1 hypothetical protein [Campylobacter sp. JMF_07 ED4]MDA3063272.1 hypothetical protein [Campylobacter sp. JMF_11 EL3]MDA3071582.1 hypothetical protein [Campylobacter sp. VBCF_03 NA9]MDA3074354.1 hypothetical protein [Campylobacter sp. JMF_05 ED3]